MRSRLASVALGVALLGGAATPAVVVAPAASAHSVLLSVDPENGSTVESSPERVTLTFNEEINQSFATIAVTTADDRTNRASEELEFDGPSVSTGVDELPPGEYTVGYRVTSADGHVVGGSSTFTVGGGTAPAGDPASTEGAAAADEADTANASDGESTGFGTALWIVGGLAVLLVGGALVLLRRGGN